MRKVTVSVSKKYDVLIGAGLLGKVGELVNNVKDTGNVCIVTDENVMTLYADVVCNSLVEKGYSVCSFVIKPGEESKNMQTLNELVEFLAAKRFSRSDLVIALGGGVIGDFAGFAASVYLRGIDFIQIPTTFLAAVDSSVGGKTAVNLAAGKNLAGAFYQPMLVICDVNTFSTLTPEIFSDGIAEAIKHGIICDEELFEILANTDIRTEPEILEEVVERNIKIKKEFVQDDEFDTSKRQMLNLGHTLGHSIEKMSDYKIPHGSAVAIGLSIISGIAEKNGIAKEPIHDRICTVLKKYGLPVTTDYPIEQLAEIALSDKKINSSKIALVIPKAIGNTILYEIPVSELKIFLTKGV